ncbi:MAG: NTP transferase domain-containing protein [Firmicutes bacterium]|nr:NTP transferase domain-containing protein [Bacillota bacterium]
MIEKERVCGLLLAAGLSRRMGAVKMNLPLADGHTVLEHATEAMLGAGIEHIVVVLGGHEQEIRANYRYADRVRLTVNPDYEQGMFTSVRAGLRAILELGDFDAFLLHPGDVPQIAPQTVDLLCREFEPGIADIVLPEHGGRGGHPALYSLAYARKILHEDYPEGMRSLLREERDRVRRVKVEEQAVLADLDTPEDYRKMLIEQQTLRHTRSVCPVCLRSLPARITRRQGAVYLEKECPVHGGFAVPVWRDLVDLDEWRGPLPEPAPGENENCPHGCGICGEHRSGTCCLLLEVTRRCNLRCRFCFAAGEEPEPTLYGLKRTVDDVIEKAGYPLLQLSGGEPTLRDDLPQLIAYARQRGLKYIQLNSNGLRLSEDEGYVKRLAESGLSFVFMQFDGVDNGVYMKLRQAPLLKQKLRAVELCDKYNIGVTLVPTVVRGVNDRQIGDIIRLAASLSPAVRGVHFQPVSYFGRYPEEPEDADRYTLDELLAALSEQAGIAPENILPSRCDHPLCGCHGSFVVLPDRSLLPLSRREPRSASCQTTAEQNREYVGRHWQRQEKPCCCGEPEEEADMESLDGFARRARSHAFTVTAMAFQDAMNLDMERLRRCSLHVYDQGKIKPFCSRYLTATEEKHGLR